MARFPRQCTALLPAVLLLAFSPAAHPQAPDHEFPRDQDAKCVKCHARDRQKELESGEELPLLVDAEAFAGSIHGAIGCAGCHRDAAAGPHPSREPIPSRHEYALRQIQACRNCHTGLYEAWSQSIHAHRLEAGSKMAPVCTDCHRVHDITAVASAGFLVSTCTRCHGGAPAAHEQWLPNAAMHLDSVACAACHSPRASLLVDLHLYDRRSGAPLGAGELNDMLRRELTAIGGGEEGLDAQDLWKLHRLTRSSDGGNLVLRGRLGVAEGADAHRLADISRATRSCESCHENRSAAFSQVSFSLTRPDGRREYFAADSAVLGSILSVDSLSEFYAPRGTRVRLLDYLVLAALLAGLILPLLHLAAGYLVRRRHGRGARGKGSGS